VGLRVQVYFDVQQLYYIPQYTPVQKQLERFGANCTYVVYRDPFLLKVQEKAVKALNCNIIWVEDWVEARKCYTSDKPDWLILGNNFEGLSELHAFTRTALISHGIGPKACYYSVSDSKPNVRFVEGPYRTQRLKEMYPDSVFVDTGYAKLDPIVSGELSCLKPSEFGLDNNKKTILYAPTFYPSSIECFSKTFPLEFSEYNIIIKPHYFSLANPKYKKQRRLLELWAKSKNVYLVDIDGLDITPYMAVSDLLVSDASSTLFEFSALNKPVVWCDFYKLRLGYRGLMKYRFTKRMDKDLYKYADVAVHAKNYKDLKKQVDSQILNPKEKEYFRLKYTSALIGLVDGNVSKRIASYMFQCVGEESA